MFLNNVNRTLRIVILLLFKVSMASMSYLKILARFLLVHTAKFWENKPFIEMKGLATVLTWLIYNV